MRRWVLVAAVGVLALVAWAIRPHPATQTTSADRLHVVASNDAPPAAQAATAYPTGQAGSAAVPASEPDAAGATPAPDAPAWTREDPATDVRALYARVRSERRDNGWAGASETQIRAQLARIPYIGGGEPLDVTCRSSVCEVAGSFAKELSVANTNVAMQALQGPALHDPLRASRLDTAAQIYGSDANGRGTYTLYILRQPAS